MLGAALLCGCPQPEPHPKGETEPYLVLSQGTWIDVECDDAELTTVMDQISREVSHPIVVDSAIQETVTVSLREIPWREAVEVVARMARCEVVERPDGALLITRCTVVRVDFEQVDVRAVLQLLAAYQGKEIQLPDDLQGQVDVHVVASEGAIEAVLEQVGEYRVVSEGEDRLRVVQEDIAPAGD